jgi:PKD repeat protein
LEEVVITHVYSVAGSYTVKLQVKDDDGATSIDSYIIDIIQLEPDQYPPVAQIELNPEEDIFINETISFDASGSYDPDGVIVSYLWDFGDGNTSILVNPLHSYTQSGNYTVILAVTDDDGLTNAAAVTISILENETVEPEEEPKERELPLMCLTIILVAIIVALIIIIFFIKEYGLTLEMEESEETKKNKTENVESEVDELLSKRK